LRSVFILLINGILLYMLYFFNYLLFDDTVQLDETNAVTNRIIKNIRPSQINVVIFLYYARVMKNITFHNSCMNYVHHAHISHRNHIDSQIR